MSKVCYVVACILAVFAAFSFRPGGFEPGWMSVACIALGLAL